MFSIQVTRLQSERCEELQRLRVLVCETQKDETIRLETPWKEYFKTRLDWASGDGKTASLTDIDKRYNEAQQRVR